MVQGVRAVWSGGSSFKVYVYEVIMRFRDTSLGPGELGGLMGFEDYRTHCLRLGLRSMGLNA